MRTPCLEMGERGGDQEVRSRKRGGGRGQWCRVIYIIVKTWDFAGRKT